MNNGQKTPRGHPDFNSYVNTPHVMVFQTDRQTDRWTDGRTETLIRGGFPHYVPPGKPASYTCKIRSNSWMKFKLESYLYKVEVQVRILIRDK
jgi:hypothetical protein